MRAAEAAANESQPRVIEKNAGPVKSRSRNGVTCIGPGDVAVTNLEPLGSGRSHIDRIGTGQTKDRGVVRTRNYLRIPVGGRMKCAAGRVVPYNLVGRCARAYGDLSREVEVQGAPEKQLCIEFELYSVIAWT